MTLRTVRWEGATTAATLPAGDGALTAGVLTPNTGVTLSAGSLTQYQPNEVWTVTHATARTTLSAAVTNGGYHSVTISRTGGMIPKAVRIKAARGGASSPRGFAIRSSVDSYTADLISVADVATQRATLTQYASADLTALGSQTSITFRIYHFAPLNSAAVDLDDLEVDYEDTAAAVVNESGSLASLVAEVYTNRTSASADEAYDVPTTGQAATLSGAYGKLMTGDFTGAATDVNSLGYDVVLLSDTVTGRSHALLRERSPSTRYWGLYVWSREAARTPMVVEAPHTKADANTHTEGQSLFDKANAKAFLMSTAHRNSNAALDVDGDRVSDLANADVVNPFQSVHVVAATSGSTVVQVHGYADATEPSYDVIVSEGQSTPSQRTQNLAASLRTSTGLRVGVYDGTVGAGLGATGNVQGIQSRAAGIYWVHVEQNTTTRSNTTTRGLIEDTLATLVTAPGAGTASGTVSFTGTAIGKRAPKATGSGSWTFTGAAVGAAPATISPATVLNVGTGTGQNHFELQMARSGDAAWTEITQAQIAAGYEETPYFTTVRGGTAVQLSVPLDAPLVGASTGPRAEMREVNADGSYAAYDINVGVHEVHGRSRVMSGTPDIVLAQFHNGTTDRITLRTQFVTSTLRLRARVNGSSIPTELAGPYIVGTEFEWKIRVDNGAISIFFNDMVTPIYTAPAGTLVPTAGVSTWYFKTGAYAQATGASTSSAVTELRDLSVTHTGVAAPAQGSASGSWSFTGTATGTRAPKATATGSFTFAGSATGRRTPKAIGSGAWTFTGAATGKRTPKATATGAATWIGAAAGRRVPKSTAVGTVGYTGAAVGLAPIVSDYHPHTPVTATLQFTPGTATLAGDGIGTAVLAAQPIATAVITYTPGTAELHLT